MTRKWTVAKIGKRKLVSVQVGSCYWKVLLVQSSLTGNVSNGGNAAKRTHNDCTQASWFSNALDPQTFTYSRRCIQHESALDTGLYPSGDKIFEGSPPPFYA